MIKHFAFATAVALAAVTAADSRTIKEGPQSTLSSHSLQATLRLVASFSPMGNKNPNLTEIER